MYRKIFILGIFLSIFWSGKLAAQPQYGYQVNFTDKNNTPYRLTSPEYYLSERSIIRRLNHGIPIDSTDIPVNSTYIDSVLSLTGGVFHEASKWKNLMVVLVMDTNFVVGTDTVGITTLISSLAFVNNVQMVAAYDSPLHLRRANAKPSKIPAQYQRTTSGDADYYGTGTTWAQTRLVNGNYLNDLGYKGAGMMISIVDAGFTGADTCPFGFDSLWNSARIIDTHDFVFHAGSVYYNDWHGTEVLSTMAAYVPDTFVGAAPLAMYNLYITETDNLGNDQPIHLINLVCGAERADSVGTDIITCSLGYNTFAAPFTSLVFNSDLDGKTTMAAQAANIATKKGILFVATAGNQATDPSWPWLLTPGDADSALTIGATYSDGMITGFSGLGPNAAGQVKPDVCAQGGGTAVINDNIYTEDDGTSFSTPTVAGFAACLWEANPTATPYQLRQVIDECASMYYTPGPPYNAQYGYGVADFECSEQTMLYVKAIPIQGGGLAHSLSQPVQ